MDAYDKNPDDIYLLEVGIGSITGTLTNIQLNGASSMGLHGDPSKLIHDYYDADYGMSFYGLSFTYRVPMLLITKCLANRFAIYAI